MIPSPLRTGLAIAVPLSVLGQMVVNMLWSLAVFREISGTRNLVLLSVAAVCSVAAVSLLGYAKVG